VIQIQIAVILYEGEWAVRVMADRVRPQVKNLF
jgi:hypothetical protein